MTKKTIKHELKELTLAELAGLSRLINKQLEKKSKEEILEPGLHNFDVTVRANGSVVKAQPQEASQSFRLGDLLSPIVLLYASKQNDPNQFLADLLNPALIKKVVGPSIDKVIANKVDPGTLAMYDGLVAQAKAIFHDSTEKIVKNGATTVTGTLEVVE
jgi:hypothetical protein